MKWNNYLLIDFFTFIIKMKAVGNKTTLFYNVCTQVAGHVEFP